MPYIHLIRNIKTGRLIMRDTVLWRKHSRIIMKLADALQIDAERALDIFYSTKTYQQLSDSKYGLQLMSDDYILEELMDELRGNNEENNKSFRSSLALH